MRNSIFERYDFKAIGQAIKAARESRGITLEQLAEMMNLPTIWMLLQPSLMKVLEG
jgi:transcriptional regulator with XRE-family HTH domain